MITPLGLTLKHVVDSGEVFYIAAHYVRLIPEHGDVRARVLFDAGDRVPGEVPSREITHGTIFIMNNAGRTVDTIRLGSAAPKE